MPGWRDKFQPFVDRGELTVIGVVQEQHPDRARLYRQWRELRWPILVDSLNLTGLQVVPVPMALDENGIVQPFRRGDTVERFLASKTPRRADLKDYNILPVPDLLRLREEATASSSVDDWLRLGDALFLSGSLDDLTESIDIYGKARALDPRHGPAAFRLGVALQKRAESERRRAGDAQGAVECWGDALTLVPNQYIWRRRIQQYGPRLAKPYNFYFWVEQARAEIRARGEEPWPLRTEPTGSEILAREEARDVGRPLDLDPRREIAADSSRFVEIEAVVVPARVPPGDRVRVRLTLRPSRKGAAEWNNEADPLTVFAGLPEGLAIRDGQFQLDNPPSPQSAEARVVELELEIPGSAVPGLVKVPSYALYSICEKATGVCRYLRQDFEILIQVDDRAAKLVN